MGSRVSVRRSTFLEGEARVLAIPRFLGRVAEVEGVRRRRLLASVAVLTTGGCLGPARRLATGTFGGATAGGDGATDACPSFADDVDRTICAGETTTDAPVEFRRSGRTLSTDAGTPSTADSGGTVETLRFTLENQSERTFSFNPYHWRLRRETPTGWRPKAKRTTAARRPKARPTTATTRPVPESSASAVSR